MLQGICTPFLEERVSFASAGCKRVICHQKGSQPQERCRLRVAEERYNKSLGSLWNFLDAYGTWSPPYLCSALFVRK
jgi:hypothetical protein